MLLKIHWGNFRVDENYLPYTKANAPAEKIFYQLLSVSVEENPEGRIKKDGHCLRPAVGGRSGRSDTVGPPRRAGTAEHLHPSRSSLRAQAHRHPVVARKDPNVDLACAQGLFGRVPCPAMHVDTGKKFPRCTCFATVTPRSGNSISWSSRVLRSTPSIRPMPPAARSAARKTEGLKLALAKHGFDGLVAGIRRDEEATRAKERVFSERRRRPVGCTTSRRSSGTTSTLRRRRARICVCIRSCIGPRRATSGPIPSAKASPSSPYLARDGKRYRSLGDADITFPVELERQHHR